MATAPATVPYSAMFESAGTVAGAAASYTTTWDVTASPDPLRGDAEGDTGAVGFRLSP